MHQNGKPRQTLAMITAGMAVELEVAGRSSQLSKVVDRSAYRIVQESLTNVMKHAPAARVHVSIVYDDQALKLVVSDDGAPAGRANGDAGGRGLLGMRERAAILGGEIAYGPEPTGGFSVEATLPVGARA